MLPLKEHSLMYNEFLNRSNKAFYHIDYHSRNIATLGCLYTPYQANNFIDSKFTTAYSQAFIYIIDALAKLRPLCTTSPIILHIPHRSLREPCTHKETILQTAIDLATQYFRLEDGTSYITPKDDRLIEQDDEASYYINSYDPFYERESIPYKGFLKDTYDIYTQALENRSILLIDDVYISTENYLEEAIQTLLNMYAKEVFLYTIGRYIAPPTPNDYNPRFYMDYTTVPY